MKNEDKVICELEKTNTIITNEVKRSGQTFFCFTCVKNGKDFISNLLHSLVKQTKHNFVHYIYNDGSTDNLRTVIEEYINITKNIDVPYPVIYEENVENIGLNASTLHCIKQCKEPYFIWIDCDNWVCETFFEEMEKTIINNPGRILYRSNLIRVDENGFSWRPLDNKYVKRRINYGRNLYQLIAGLYSHSFFAVDFEKYRKGSNSFDYSLDKNVFPDLQVVFLAALLDDCFCFSKDAFGIQLIRKNSESSSNFNLNSVNSFYISLAKSNKVDCDIAYLLTNISESCNLFSFYKSRSFFRLARIEIKRKRLLLKKCGLSRRIGHVYKNDWWYLVIFIFYPFLMLLDRMRAKNRSR